MVCFFALRVGSRAVLALFCFSRRDFTLFQVLGAPGAFFFVLVGCHAPFNNTSRGPLLVGHRVMRECVRGRAPVRGGQLSKISEPPLSLHSSFYLVVYFVFVCLQMLFLVPAGLWSVLDLTAFFARPCNFALLSVRTGQN